MPQYATPFDAAVTAAPMFGRAPEPQMFQPFNIPGLGGQGLSGAAMQMFLPMLAQGFMKQQGMVPSQFLPTQNLYDQFLGQQYHQQQQQAMSLASGRDLQSMQQTIQGVQRLMTGKAPTIQQQRQSFQMANQLQGAMPYLSMFLGAETVEQLMGPQGSATMMAQSMHRGLRQYRDPVTGGLGVRGRASGEIATEVFEQLYGEGADRSRMRGLTAGQTGRMFEELTARGMAGPTFGSMNQEDRLRQIASMGFTEGTMRRVAENRLRAEGRDVTVENMEAAASEIFGSRDPVTGERVGTPDSTIGRIRAAADTGNLDMRALEDFGAGTEELLSAGAAQRISSRLKNLSGAVSAMRDIFGDMGRPNAPMRELINGLEALTQGGLASMSPGAMETMVRTTQALARRSGLGVQGMLGLQAQAANMADAMGLDRSLAVQATQASAAFGTAARQTQRLDIPTFGGLTAEESTLLNQQLQVQSAGSQTTNMLAATVRMLNEGMIDPDTEAGRMAQALMADPNATTWVDANGEVRSMAMNNAEWVRLMRESGANESTARAVLGDQYMNQRETRNFSLQQAGRNMQREVDLDWRMRNTFANSLFTQFTSQEMTDLLDQRGVIDRGEIGRLQMGMAERMTEAFFNMDAATVRDAQARNDAMARAAQDALEAEVRAAGGDDADVQAALDQLGPEDPETGLRQGSREMGVAMLAGMGQRIRTDRNLQGYKSIVGLWQMQNPLTLQAQAAEMAEAETEGRMRTAFSRMGRAGPIQRLIGEIQRAGPDTTFGEIIARVGGGIPEEELARLEDGPIGGLMAAQRAFDDAERYTEAQVRQEMLDRRAATAAGESLEAYRQRQQSDLGDDWRQRAEDYINVQQEAADDEAFQRQVDARVDTQVGMLTGRGMAQRGLAARVVEAIQTGGAQAETVLEELARTRIGEDATQADFTEAYFNAREAEATTEDERRRVADLRRMVDSLRQAREGMTATKAMEQVGVATGVKIGAGEVEGVNLLGEESVTALEDLDALTRGGLDTEKKREAWTKQQKDTSDAISSFLTNARDMADTIESNVEDMQQLGVEGVDSLRNVQREQADLERWAAEVSEKYGTPVTAAQLVAGDVPEGAEEYVKMARGAHSRLRKAWQDVSDIKGTGIMPGKPGSKAQALSAAAIGVLKETAEFKVGEAFMPERAQQMTAAQRDQHIREQQARAVTAGLLKQMGGDTTAFMDDEGKLTAAGRQIQEMIDETGRAVPIKQALAARRRLVDIAAGTGFTVDGKKMTAAQLREAGGDVQQQAITALREKLEAGDLDDDQARSVRQLLEMQEPLRGIGRGGATISGLEERIEQFRSVSRAAADAEKESKRKLALSGTVRILNPEALAIAGDVGMGDVDHNDVNTTLMGNLVPGQIA